MQTLEDLCIKSYLDFLEEHCAVYAELAVVENKVVTQIAKALFNTLRNDLQPYLQGLLR